MLGQDAGKSRRFSAESAAGTFAVACALTHGVRPNVSMFHWRRSLSVVHDHVDECGCHAQQRRSRSASRADLPKDRDSAGPARRSASGPVAGQRPARSRITVLALAGSGVVFDNAGRENFVLRRFDATRHRVGPEDSRDLGRPRKSAAPCAAAVRAAMRAPISTQMSVRAPCSLTSVRFSALCPTCSARNVVFG